MRVIYKANPTFKVLAIREFLQKEIKVFKFDSARGVIWVIDVKENLFLIMPPVYTILSALAGEMDWLFDSGRASGEK